MVQNIQVLIWAVFQAADPWHFTSSQGREQNWSNLSPYFEEQESHPWVLRPMMSSTYIPKAPPSNTIPLGVQFSLSVLYDSLLPHELRHIGPPVRHQLPEPTQTHVHWVGAAIQPSHPPPSPFPPTLNLSQHQGFFKWVSSSHQVTRVLEFQVQHQSFQWTPRTDL